MSKITRRAFLEASGTALVAGAAVAGMATTALADEAAETEAAAGEAAPSSMPVGPNGQARRPRRCRPAQLGDRSRSHPRGPDHGFRGLGRAS